MPPSQMKPSKVSVFYTGNPAPPGRKSSPQFVELGANGLVPAEIGSIKAAVHTAGTSSLKLLFLSLWTFIASLVNSISVKISENVALKLSDDVPYLFPRPNLGITITGPNANETKISKLVAAGFTKRLNGRQVYYTGPGTEEAVAAAVRLGCVTDARVPSNTVNVDGIISLSLINRILYHAFRVLGNTDALPTKISAQYDISDGEYPFTPFTEANLDTLPERGMFFSYFNGLVLPDRSYPINRFIELFSSLFGDNPSVMCSTSYTLARGWSSLNDSPAGRMISHAIFCIDKAVTAGIPLKPVFLNGEYSGCVLIGKSFILNHTQGVAIPGEKEKIREGIQSLGSHDSAVSEIATLLSTIPLRETGEEEIVTPESLNTPRAIHNQARIRKFSSNHQQLIMGLVKKLRFRQSFWDTRDAKHVQAAVHHILTGQFPDSDVPCNIATDGLWSTSPIYSVLLAFQVQAPSLRGNGAGMARTITKTMYTDIAQPGRLAGIPIFFKSHKQALEEWEEVMQYGQVYWNHGGVDKQGKLRVKAVGMYVPFDEGPAKAIMQSLMSYAGTLKRKRENVTEPEEPSEKQKEESEAAKRRKVDSYGAMFSALASNEEKDENAMEEDDFFA